MTDLWTGDPPPWGRLPLNDHFQEEAPPWYYPGNRTPDDSNTVKWNPPSLPAGLLPERPRIGTRAFLVDTLKWEILEGFFQKITGSLNTDDNTIVPFYKVVAITGGSDDRTIGMEEAFVDMYDAIQYLKENAVR